MQRSGVTSAKLSAKLSETPTVIIPEKTSGEEMPLRRRETPFELRYYMQREDRAIPMPFSVLYGSTHLISNPFFGLPESKQERITVQPALHTDIFAES